MPDPEGHGWSRAQDGVLKIDWMHGQTVLILSWNLLHVIVKNNAELGNAVA